MESKNGTSKAITDEVGGGVQMAEEAILFESLMEGIGLPIEHTSTATPPLTHGPHPISHETSETITLHYDTALNLDNDLENGNDLPSY